MPQATWSAEISWASNGCGKTAAQNADPGGIRAEVFSQIEKAMLRSADPCRTGLAASPFLLHGPSVSR
jgi:hypothetical protein